MTFISITGESKEDIATVILWLNDKGYKMHPGFARHNIVLLETEKEILVVAPLNRVYYYMPSYAVEKENIITLQAYSRHLIDSISEGHTREL